MEIRTLVSPFPNKFNALKEVREEVDREPNKFAGLVILGASHGEESDGRDYLVTSDGKPLLTETIVCLYHNEYCLGLKDMSFVPSIYAPIIYLIFWLFPRVDSIVFYNFELVSGIRIAIMIILCNR